MLKSFSKTLIASLVMGAIVYFSVAFFELNFGVQSKIMQVTEVILGIGLGALAYGVIVTLMNMEEAAIAKEILLRKFRKKKVGKQGID